MFSEIELKRKIANELMELFDKYKNNRESVSDTMLSIVFADIAYTQSSKPSHTDEYVEHAIMQWVENKLQGYKEAIRIVREGGMEELLKRYREGS